MPSPLTGGHRGSSSRPRARGFQILRNVGIGEEEGCEAYVRFDNVLVPEGAILGGRCMAFAIGQTRLGGGWANHAMRTVGAGQRALDLMCQQAVSRNTCDGKLADYQIAKEQIADSWIPLEQLRLLVMHTAKLIDKYKAYDKVGKHFAAIKVAMPAVYHDIAAKALHIHGALGVSNATPFMRMARPWRWASPTA